MQLSRNNLNQQRSALLVPEGCHAGTITTISTVKWKSGNHLVIGLQLPTGHKGEATPLIEPSSVQYQGMGIDGQIQLLDIIEGALGPQGEDGVELNGVLRALPGRVVIFDCRHKIDNAGKTRAVLSGFRSPPPASVTG